MLETRLAPSGRLLVLTDSTYQAALSEQTLPAAIEFWSFRCEACRKMAPTVSQMAQNFQGRLQVYKVNADENPRIVSEFLIPLVPYLLLLKNGRPTMAYPEEWDLSTVSAWLKDPM